MFRLHLQPAQSQSGEGSPTTDRL